MDFSYLLLHNLNMFNMMSDENEMCYDLKNENIIKIIKNIK